MTHRDSRFLDDHVALLCRSYRRWSGRDLIAPSIGPAQATSALDEAPFAVVSHGTEPDPLFNYANRIALDLFEMDWDEFTALPSRLSAEPAARAERERLLARVSTHGFADDYTGVRVAKSGRRFLIERATVWNLIEPGGPFRGQAAVLYAWRAL